MIHDWSFIITIVIVVVVFVIVTAIVIVTFSPRIIWPSDP